MKSAKEVLDSLDRICQVNEQLWYVRERILKNGESIDVEALAESTKKSLGEKGDEFNASSSSSSSTAAAAAVMAAALSSSKQKEEDSDDENKTEKIQTRTKTTKTIPTSPPWINTVTGTSVETAKVPMPSLCGCGLTLTLISTGRFASSIDRGENRGRKRHKPLSARVGRNTRGLMSQKGRA